ncbi:hypothetical protein TNCT_462481 [Trichonephila clavata]|uniref:Pre-C2HC domain-containing protein n=1 Tax=Trichonephila clavata TaxID=2740835 RepID=A0A8X6L7D4_TRICU|nr:hypothetical protein TNCT_462481 [Trichonephila clavata]
MGKSLRVYPQTLLTYQQIRKLIDGEKLEAFTHQLSEDKELKIVIRGMPVDMPIQEIFEDLHSLGITVTECKLMTNRKTGLPIPLFLLTLPKTEDNKNTFNITGLCFMKVKPEVLNKKHGHLLSGLFPLLQILHKKPEMRKVWEASLYVGLQENPQ